MKLVSKTKPKEFEPFDITFKIETMQDAIQLHSLFNCYPILNAFFNVGNAYDNFGKTVREYIEQNTNIEITTNDYKKYFDKLVENMS